MAAKQDYSYSVDKDSHLVNVINAIKGNEYYCPCCGKIMIPRQGSKRRWHFAHKGSLENCSYETYLHKVAKKSICECFNKSQQFSVSFHPKSTCAVVECPLGASQPCSWNSTKEFDLKKYYNYCQEEVSIDRFRADLMISNQSNNTPPILIEIYVTHKSTEEKLNSNHRIIEIHIESEEDIDQIVSTASIKESDIDDNYLGKEQDRKIRFYNFKADSYEVPNTIYQAYKYRFWIDSKGYFNFDEIVYHNESAKCLSLNPDEIENSRFRIESKSPIYWDFAFWKLSESGLGIRYCTMCKFYRMNDYYMRSMCILYKSKGTKQYPMLSYAMNCPHFKQIDYLHDKRYFHINYNQECKVSVR